MSRPLAAVLVAAIGCWPALAATGQPIRVSVAVSLRPALEDAVAARPGGPEVLLNAGGSAVLLHQVRRGAPADALISASPEEIDRLVDEGLADPATRRRIASNRLVVVVPPSVAPPDGVADLARPAFHHVAVGNPKTSPLGRYTRRALDALGLWDELAPRLVLAENARHALDYVARGEVAAAVVYATDARLLGDRVRAGPTIPAGLHDPILYEGVVLRDTRLPDETSALLDWLASEPGRAVLARHGFGPP